MTVQLGITSPASVQSDIENEAVSLEQLITAAAAHGLRCDRQSLAHLFVTLKAHASILIVGPAQTGKIALVSAFDQILGVGPTSHLQVMVGHARWASGTRNISKFVELQSRFNDSQMLSLMEEASQAENHRHLYIACLTRITPFEIYRYLSAPGFQFWPWMSHQKRLEPEERVLPFPLNFRLISTMDTDHFQWWDRDLLAHTAVVQWTGSRVESTTSPANTAGLPTSTAFIGTCVRETSVAYRKLKRLLRGIKEPFGPLVLVTDMLSAHGVQLPLLAMNQAIRYLANAWSKDGEGLFDASEITNLRIALDMALIQYVLPWASFTGKTSSKLQQNLTQLLNDQFPRAADFTRS